MGRKDGCWSGLLRSTKRRPVALRYKTTGGFALNTLCQIRPNMRQGARYRHATSVAEYQPKAPYVLRVFAPRGVFSDGLGSTSGRSDNSVSIEK